MGIAFHVGAVLGGISPLVANRILAATAEAPNIAYYLACALGLTLVCLTVLPETAPKRVTPPLPRRNRRRDRDRAPLNHPSPSPGGTPRTSTASPQPHSTAHIAADHLAVTTESPR
jgi:hypothetical protein